MFTSAFHVGARHQQIQDSNKSLGSEVPIGTIMAWPVDWPGDAPPKGWHICDGAPLVGAPLLQKVLGLRYAPPEPGRTEILKAKGFASHDGLVWLPDFRGYFLRGHDDSGNIDPDRKGKQIGSQQDDALQAHEHLISARPYGLGRDENDKNKEKAVWVLHGDKIVNGNKDDIAALQGHWGFTKGFVHGARSCDETRPKNYDVHWIMRTH